MSHSINDPYDFLKELMALFERKYLNANTSKTLKQTSPPVPYTLSYNSSFDESTNFLLPKFLVHIISFIFRYLNANDKCKSGSLSLRAFAGRHINFYSGIFMKVKSSEQEHFT